jgi:hypothetical protein
MRCSMEATIVRGPMEGSWALGYYYVLFADADGIRLEVNFVVDRGSSPVTPSRNAWGSTSSEPDTHPAAWRLWYRSPKGNAPATILSIDLSVVNCQQVDS